MGFFICWVVYYKLFGMFGKFVYEIVVDVFLYEDV